MPLVAQLLHIVATLFSMVCQVFYWLLIIRIILSWVGVSPYTTYNELLGALYQITDVILKPFARLPVRVGMMDFSPIVAFVVLQLLQRLLVAGLYQLGGFLR